MTYKYGSALVAAAKAQKGRAAYSSMCQAFCVITSGIGAKGDFDGDRDADAVDGWKKAVKRGKVVHAKDIKSYRDIPAGTIAYWSGGSRGYGHAAITVGGGQIVSTDAPTWGRIGQVDIGFISSRWGNGLKFLGYIIDDGDGHVFVKPAAKPAVTTKAKDAYWVVDVAKGSTLAGRNFPSTNSAWSKQTYQRKPGYLLHTTGEAKVDSSWWDVTQFGTWYSQQYLDRTHAPANKNTGTYTAKRNAALFAQPHDKSTRLSSIKTGQSFKAIGFEHDEQGRIWYVNKDYLWVCGVNVQPPLASSESTVTAMNIYSSSYWPMPRRQDDLTATLVDELGSDVYLLTEVNNDADHAAVMAALGKGFDAIRSAKNNHIYYDSAVWELYSKDDRLLGSKTTQARAVTLAVLRHRATGKLRSFACTHFSSGSNDLAGASRKAEMARLVSIVRGTPIDGWDFRNCIVGSDINSATASKGYPRDIAKKGKLRGLRDAIASVVNGQHNSHHKIGKAAAKNDEWIDELFVGPDVEVTAAVQSVKYPAASDHYGRRATYTVK